MFFLFGSLYDMSCYCVYLKCIFEVEIEWFIFWIVGEVGVRLDLDRLFFVFGFEVGFKGLGDWLKYFKDEC